MFKHPEGFSLIELMIVISIIAILTTLAVPSYQRYLKRARFMEVILATTPFKLAISLALQQGMSASELSDESSLIPDYPPQTKNLKSITVQNGQITATAANSLENATYILKPLADGTIWKISGTCFKKQYCWE